MFALLFDRKSGLLTLLAVGAIGVLLFAAGLVVGVNLSWEKLASHLPQTASTAIPTVSSSPAPAPAAASTRATPRTLLSASAEPAAFSRHDSSAPPADWVPLTDGAPWPGGAGEGETTAASAEPRARAGDSTVAGGEDFADEAPAKTTGARYFVQAGTFSDEAGAEEMRVSLRSRCRGKRYQPFVESVWDRYGRRLIAVRIGPFPDEATAQEVSTSLNGSLVGRSSGNRT
jgi:hypothetical protein